VFKCKIHVRQLFDLNPFHNTNFSFGLLSTLSSKKFGFCRIWIPTTATMHIHKS
jgi:hypothetical protein